MSSNRQRGSEIKAKRAAKRQSIQLEKAHLAQKRTICDLRDKFKGVGQAPVNPLSLGPNVSYGTPDYVTRGFYADQPFTCQDCGKEEVWTATRQKWWYEVAKGDLWTTATRCRPCRRRERDRKAAARATQLDGMAKKKAAGSSRLK